MKGYLYTNTGSSVSSSHLGARGLDVDNLANHNSLYDSGMPEEILDKHRRQARVCLFHKQSLSAKYSLEGSSRGTSPTPCPCFHVLTVIVPSSSGRLLGDRSPVDLLYLAGR